MAGQDLRNDDRIRTEYFPWGRFCFTNPQNVMLCIKCTLTDLTQPLLILVTDYPSPCNIYCN